MKSFDDLIPGDYVWEFGPAKTITRHKVITVEIWWEVRTIGNYAVRNKRLTITYDTGRTLKVSSGYCVWRDSAEHEWVVSLKEKIDYFTDSGLYEEAWELLKQVPDDENI